MILSKSLKIDDIPVKETEWEEVIKFSQKFNPRIEKKSINNRFTHHIFVFRYDIYVIWRSANHSNGYTEKNLIRANEKLEKIRQLVIIRNNLSRFRLAIENLVYSLFKEYWINKSKIS